MIPAPIQLTRSGYPPSCDIRGIFALVRELDRCQLTEHGLTVPAIEQLMIQCVLEPADEPKRDVRHYRPASAPS